MHAKCGQKSEIINSQENGLWMTADNTILKSEFLDTKSVINNF